MPTAKKGRARSGSCPDTDSVGSGGGGGGGGAGLRSGQSLDNEYFFKSQESLATVIDNDEEGDDEAGDEAVAASAADQADSKMSHSSSL